ncbi:MAG: glutamate-1-semialdehyde 2,1-aminomutase [Micrococcaceae bacterium]
MEHKTSDKLQAHAEELMPGGVSSPVRAFKSVGKAAPRFIERAKGPYLYDADGNEYVDLVCSWGPMVLGHANEKVLKAVQEATKNSLSFGTSTKSEGTLAEIVLKRVPCMEKIRFVSTGTEATMTAIRLARGYTGKDLIVKFAGCYHGHSDSLLADAGSGVATLAIPGSPGITKATASQTIVVPYNDIDLVKEVFKKYSDSIAAIITEAAPANMGVVKPKRGFNKALLELAHKHESLLISDEVLTGFRVSDAGFWGLEGRAEGWAPDIMTFGKIIGGGLPVAALAGSAKIMDYLAPVGPVYQAGTLSGNPIAMAAGIATLEACTPEVYETVNKRAKELAEFVSNEFTKAGIAHSLQQTGNLFSFAFGVNKVENYADVKKQDTKIYEQFFQTMLDNGVYLPPSVFEAWFLSAAHDDEAMDKIYQAAQKSVKAIIS